jgi:hypothetical protein
MSASFFCSCTAALVRFLWQVILNIVVSAVISNRAWITTYYTWPLVSPLVVPSKDNFRPEESVTHLHPFRPNQREVTRVVASTTQHNEEQSDDARINQPKVNLTLAKNKLTQPVSEDLSIATTTPWTPGLEHEQVA